MRRIQAFQTVDPRDTTVTRSGSPSGPVSAAPGAPSPVPAVSCRGVGGQPDEQRHQQRRGRGRQRDARVVDRGAQRQAQGAGEQRRRAARRRRQRTGRRAAPPSHGCAAARPGGPARPRRRARPAASRPAGCPAGCRGWPAALRLTTVHASPVSTCSTKRPRWLRSVGRAAASPGRRRCRRPPRRRRGSRPAARR